MNTQASALLLRFFFAKAAQLEELGNVEALADLDKLVVSQLPDAGRLWERFRKPQSHDDRERILNRVIELAAGHPISSIVPVHGPEGL